MSLPPRAKDLGGRILACIENRLSEDRRRKFRKLQHERFGLQQDEWDALYTVLASCEALNVIFQRQETFLKKINIFAFHLQVANARTGRRAEAYRNFQQNFEEYERRLEELGSAERKIRHTPVYRALQEHRLRRYWQCNEFLTKRCRESGGCCARLRDCGCCEKKRDVKKKARARSSRSDRDVRVSVWNGHCTPACPCCMKHYGIREPIPNLEDPIQLSYSVRPEPDDYFSRQMMDAVVWGLPRAV
ncbi:hypothetical protein BJX64DRAFT_299623 [Aspergillus heterothallicus]